MIERIKAFWYTKLAKMKQREVKTDNFCYYKVGRAITKWGVIEISPILLLGAPIIFALYL